MLKMLNELRFGNAFRRLVEDPRRTEEVFKLSDVGLKLHPSKALELAVGRAMADDGFRELFNARYRTPPVDFKRLGNLPTNTLGHQYFLHMTRNGLKPDFFPDTACRNEVEYLIQRGREAHDIWHVLTDYDTSVADEMALQAFTLAHLDSPISAVILASGFLHYTRTEPSKLGELIELIDEGHERGRETRYMLGVQWENHWDMKLEDARSWMRIPPRKSARAIAS
jgi:ubiquinone biosynthesis protein Coq4